MRVGSAVSGVASGVTGRLQLIPVRHSEVVSQRVPAGRSRGRVNGDQKAEHAEPVRSGGELTPLEALTVDERVDRDAESVVHPRQRLAITGGNWRHHERATA